MTGVAVWLSWSTPHRFWNKCTHAVCPPASGTGNRSQGRTRRAIQSAGLRSGSSGYAHHIVQRGHNRAACFFGEEDYQTYRHWLGEALANTGAALHAYVLMTNHVHLLVTPKAAEDIPQLVITIGRRYVQTINKTYRRTGTLWDSRYKSSLIQTDTYLLRYQRYIELNPVRADMVRHPGEYAWSSYRANGLGANDPLLSPHTLYLELGASPDSQQAAYRELFRTGLDEAALRAYPKRPVARQVMIPSARWIMAK
ncbi:putative transposase [Allochromatium warmingii]|uniref:Putative transposase n=1 Tax=Allochromatium warmingii TaxID=61595 RepID=A0A1H3K293_ALLWA|nr:putative transposase [Allochromatium warmingii]